MQYIVIPILLFCENPLRNWKYACGRSSYNPIYCENPLRNWKRREYVATAVYNCCENPLRNWKAYGSIWTIISHFISWESVKELKGLLLQILHGAVTTRENPLRNWKAISSVISTLSSLICENPLRNWKYHIHLFIYLSDDKLWESVKELKV